MLAPVGLDIVCFRYNPGGLNEEELNRLNKEIKIQLELRGVAVYGYTTLGEKYALRAAICNHRSVMEDFDEVLNAILMIGAEIHREIIAEA